MKIELTPEEAKTIIPIKDGMILTRSYLEKFVSFKSHDNILEQIDDADEIVLLDDGRHIRIDIDDDKYQYLYIPTDESLLESFEKKKKRLKTLMPPEIIDDDETVCIIKTEQTDKLMEKIEEENRTTTLEGAIRFYNQTNKEIEEKLEILDKQYEYLVDNLKKVLKDRVGINPENVTISENYLKLVFPDEIPYTVIMELENAGVTYNITRGQEYMIINIDLELAKKEA